ncbi:hypothetical protein M432DRAFT_280942 [Thermoascus aurantiacus ATCC 26904]
MPGKRKRDTTVVSRTVEEEDREPSPDVADSSHDIFRRYFESRFEPLEPIPVKNSQSSQSTTAINEDEDEDENEDTDSEWDGISEENDDSPQVEVVEHMDTRNMTDNMLVDKKSRKAFMNSKPPSFSDSSTIKSTSTKKDQEDDDDAMDAEDLKNDLALQRLLKESHLLESASDLNPTGKNRHKAIDLRIQALGAKKSIYTQEKMPMSHRRGILAKAAKREEKRRREARENGIILEKPTFKPKNSNKRRERGIGGPSVGKFVGGTLKLSKADVTRIQGPSKESKGKSKGRR